MFRRLIWVSSVQKRVLRVRIRAETSTSSSSRQQRSSSCFLTETCTTATATTDQQHRHQHPSDRYNSRILWPVSNLLPIHLRSLGGHSYTSTATNIKARYFSTSLDANNAAADANAVIEATRRRAALRTRRKKLENKQKKSKKSKNTTMTNRKQILRRHQPASFETLFDQIASRNKNLFSFESLISRLQKTIKQDGTIDKAASSSITLPFHPSNTVHTVLDFLLSTTSSLKDGNTKQVTDEHEALLEEANAIATLQAARVCSLEQAWGWNRLDLEAIAKEPTVMEERQALHATKTEDELKEQARQLSVVLVEKLPAYNFRKFIRYLEAYVNAHSTEPISASASPSASASELAVSDESEFEDVSSSDETEEVAGTATSTAATKSRKLRHELNLNTKGRFHLVAADTADFFYMNVGLDYNVVATDTHITQLKEKWKEKKEKFVHVMMDVQEKLLASVEDMDDDEVQVIKGLILLSPTKKTNKDDRRLSPPAHVVFDAMALRDAATTEDYDGNVDLNEDGMNSSIIAPPKSKQIVSVRWYEPRNL
jgi:hypothetical protein